MKIISIMIASALMAQSLQAKSTTALLGDAFAAGLPLSAGAYAYFKDNKEGQMQFIKSYTATMATTMALKYTVREKRPDTDEHDSFPSGHTSSAFAGASFIHQRYGWKMALVPYVAALYTGYSRIQVNRHHTHDVLAGAALALASSWYFVTPYKNVSIHALNDGKRNKIELTYNY